ncbi:hypothetical protein CFOL_v3_20447 [Cephalotus follicularis]|uniref:Uncharacterized protein n=1 Tax=Cephalotus follicularis TaxID=3775 RepID=A0A1Q3C9S2_CEPFO|nr:hypothetical protein CFOL_v3_20447 [Cephalotus follicularis]
MIQSLQKSTDDLIPIEVTISNFEGGITQARGVLPVKLTIGGKTSMSSLHQCLILWNGGNIKVVQANGWSFLAGSKAMEVRYYDNELS